MPPIRSGTAWIRYPSPNPEASIRLFCFPYAGAGVAAFAAWPGGLTADVEVAVVLLPGREQRIAEAPYTQLASLISDLADALAPQLTKPFAFFGHSLGALIGFELARELRRQGMAEPSHLFVSAHRGPHLPDRTRPLHKLPEAELVRELKRLNGTPEIVFKHPELWRLIQPVLRADLELCERYHYSPAARLNCPITAFAGNKDPRANVAEVAAWQEETDGPFSFQIFDGDHFFLHSSQKELWALIRQELGQLI